MQESYPNLQSGGATALAQYTAQQLSTTNVPCKKVEIQALPTNAGNIAIGGSLVSANPASPKGLQLPAGGIITVYAEDLISLFVSFANGADGITYNYYF